VDPRIIRGDLEEVVGDLSLEVLREIVASAAVRQRYGPKRGRVLLSLKVPAFAHRRVPQLRTCQHPVSTWVGPDAGTETADLVPHGHG